MFSNCAFSRLISSFVATLLPIAGLSVPRAAAQTVEVAIHHFAFAPADLTVFLGTTVRWENHDGIIHTVTSQTGPGTLVPSGLFDSGDLDFGDTFEFTFLQERTVDYFCAPHGSSMQGVVRALARPGDADRDGDVDLSDLSILLAAFGSCTGESAYITDADFNADGCNDISDLSLLIANFGL